jgi:hypothetical protein
MVFNRVVGRSSGIGVFFIFLIVGLYFLNASLKFFTIPVALTSNAMYNQVLFFIAGVLILIGGFKFLLQRRY